MFLQELRVLVLGVYLVLANNNNIVRKVTVDSLLGKSDHATILVNSVVSMTEKENLPSYFLYGKGNYQALRNDLDNVNWETESKICKNVYGTSMWQIFCKHMLDGRNAYVPKMHKTAAFKERPPWLKKDILHAIEEKTCAYRKWCKSRLDQDYIFYCKKRNYVTKLIRNSIKTFEKGISMSIEDNPKKFWKYVKSKTRFQHKVVDLVNKNNTACSLDNG